MSFAADIRQWRTVQAFTDHLYRHDPAICRWAAGATIHHTVVPTVPTWRGLRTMIGMRDYYIRKQWTSGPHLFLVNGSPSPANDGIWQLTPLNLRGTHAGPCNVLHWGVEVVGNYDAAPWPAELAELVYDTIGALFRWRGIRTIGAVSLRGHRECLSNKSCPGRAINMDAVRREMERRL
jgi:hypothetical protein